MSTHKAMLIALLLLGLILRLAYAFSLDPAPFYMGNGGDSAFYMQVGRDLLSPLDYSDIPIPVPPVYLLFVGIWQHLISVEGAVYVIWVLQSLMSVLTCYLAYRMTRHLTANDKAALIVAGALVLSPAMIIEVAQILTETLYITFVMLGLTLYVEGVVSLPDDVPVMRRWLFIALCAVIWGLAALTRSVFLAFPVGIAIHLLLIGRKRLIPLLLVVYALTVFSWTAYQLIHWNWWTISSNQLAPTIWRGALEESGSPSENDELLGEDTPAEQAAAIIQSDPAGYIMRRVEQFSAAYLQPHGTIAIGGASLKDLGMGWVNSGFDLAVLWQLLSQPQFWPKLLIYIWHYIALIGGLIGMWLTRQRWPVSLALIGFVAYTSAVHLILLALPRYIFPTYPLWWIFAAVALAWAYEQLKQKGDST